MPGFWRVTVVYGLGLILMAGLILVMSAFVARSGGAAYFAGGLAIALLVPALVAGMSFGRHTGRKAAPSEAWRFAGWFTIIQGLLFALLLWQSMQELLARDSDGVVILAVVLSLCMAVSLPMSRCFFGLGAGQAARGRGPH